MRLDFAKSGIIGQLLMSTAHAGHLKYLNLFKYVKIDFKDVKCFMQNSCL